MSRSVSAYGLQSYHGKRGEKTERESMASLDTGSSPGGPGQDLPLCKVRKTFKLPSWSIGHCDWKVIGSLPFVNIPNPLLAAGSFGGKLRNIVSHQQRLGPREQFNRRHWAGPNSTGPKSIRLVRSCIVTD